MTTRNLVLLLCLAAVPAHGEPPWTVDDPGTTAAGTGTFYLNYDMERHRAGDSAETVPNMSVTLGLGEATELGLALPLAKVTPAPEETKVGLGDVVGAVKHRFWENEAGDGVAVSAQLTAPTGRRSDGLGSGEFAGSVGLMSQLSSTRWKLVGQIAASRTLRSSEAPVWLFGGVLSRGLSRSSFAGVQVYSTRQPVEGGETENFIVGLGGGVRFSENGGAQVQISRGFGENIDWAAYAGLTFDFNSRF